jgi:hypothetical protein
MKTYFDIDKAEAAMRTTYQTALEAARNSANSSDDLAFVEAQARFIPAQLDIMKTLLVLSNEGTDAKLAVIAVSAVVASIAQSCDLMLPGLRFHLHLRRAMDTLRNGQGVTLAQTGIKAEPLS